MDCAIQTSCYGKLFRSKCIRSWLSMHNTCPACDIEMVASLLRHAGTVDYRLLGNSSVQCDFHKPALDGCPTIIPVKFLQSHVHTCSFNPGTSAKRQPIRAVLQSFTVADVTKASPSKLQGNVAANLMARLVTATA